MACLAQATLISIISHFPSGDIIPFPGSNITNASDYIEWYDEVLIKDRRDGYIKMADCIANKCSEKKKVKCRSKGLKSYTKELDKVFTSDNSTRRRAQIVCSDARQDCFNFLACESVCNVCPLEVSCSARIEFACRKAKELAATACNFAFDESLDPDELEFWTALMEQECTLAEIKVADTCADDIDIDITKCDISPLGTLTYDECFSLCNLESDLCFNCEQYAPLFGGSTPMISSCGCSCPPTFNCPLNDWSTGGVCVGYTICINPTPTGVGSLFCGLDTPTIRCVENEVIASTSVKCSPPP